MMKQTKNKSGKKKMTDAGTIKNLDNYTEKITYNNTRRYNNGGGLNFNIV